MTLDAHLKRAMRSPLFVRNDPTLRLNQSIQKAREHDWNRKQALLYWITNGSKGLRV